MKIIFMGPSGAGKGTISAFITRDYGIPHVSSGDIFRDHLRRGTELGREVEGFMKAGHWIPDEITMKVIFDRLGQPDVADGFLLDGVPRTMAQANLLNEQINVDLVIELDVSDEIVIDRLGGRFMCRGCGTIHNRRFDSVDVCKECGGELFQRNDDRDDAIRNRLASYRKYASQIADFYRDMGKLFVVHVKPSDLPIDNYNTIKEKLEEFYGD
ncbi:MAG: nucleoside monophosphate kinase [Firmicutes bacterium]|nr:nucleoside monophosphate kinase [Bacillota bacterium]